MRLVVATVAAVALLTIPAGAQSPGGVYWGAADQGLPE